MTETPAQTVPEWNPLASVEPVKTPLAVSGGRASIILRRWTGRERLAYEDAITERMLTKDGAGEETVKIGTLRLYAISLTVVGEEGFPTRPDGSRLFTGGREAVESDLLALDPDTFDEIRKRALELQPLPSAGGDESSKGDDDESELPDPSSASSTSQTPTGDVDA